VFFSLVFFVFVEREEKGRVSEFMSRTKADFI